MTISLPSSSSAFLTSNPILFYADYFNLYSSIEIFRHLHQKAYFPLAWSPVHCGENLVKFSLSKTKFCTISRKEPNNSDSVIIDATVLQNKDAFDFVAYFYKKLVFSSFLIIKLVHALYIPNSNKSGVLFPFLMSSITYNPSDTCFHQKHGNTPYQWPYPDCPTSHIHPIAKWSKIYTYSISTSPAFAWRN